MYKFSLCIEPVLSDLDFYRRIPAAAELGFDAVEFWDPEGKDIDRIAKLAVQNKVAVSICGALDPWGKRMNAPADIVVPNIRESMKIAKEMGCYSLIVLSGDVDDQGEAQKNVLIDNLKRVADLAVKEGVTLNLESLNTLVDHKGYYLDSSCIGFEIVKAVRCDYVRLLYDVYHMQIMEGNIIDNLTKNIDYIGHFHSAGVPGRHEHMSGENDYRNILQAIAATNYDRFFGLEYWPTYDHRQSLADVLRYLKS